MPLCLSEMRWHYKKITKISAFPFFSEDFFLFASMKYKLNSITFAYS